MKYSEQTKQIYFMQVLFIYTVKNTRLSESSKWSKFDSVFLRYSASVYLVFMTPIRKVGTKEK